MLVVFGLLPASSGWGLLEPGDLSGLMMEFHSWGHFDAIETSNSSRSSLDLDEQYFLTSSQTGREVDGNGGPAIVSTPYCCTVLHTCTDLCSQLV